MVYIDGGTSLINATDDGINGAGEQPDTAPYKNPYTASDHSGLFTDTVAAAKPDQPCPVVTAEGRAARIPAPLRMQAMAI